jgi:hypothetical protein
MRSAVRRGVLVARKVAPRLNVVSAAELERYRAEHLRRVGRRRKEQGGDDDEALRAETESTMRHIADAENHVAQSQQVLRDVPQRMGLDGDEGGE